MTVLQSDEAVSQCPREQASCDGKCLGNSTCVGDFDGGFTCHCLPGYMGENCDQGMVIVTKIKILTKIFLIFRFYGYICN